MTTGLLLIHGFPLDAGMWKPQIDGLNLSMPVVAVNLPGFGGQAVAGPVTSMDAMADAAIEQARAAGLDRAIVCGLSMGGYVALAIWRRHRAFVAGLVFANTRAGADDEAGKARRIALAERVRAEGSQVMADNPPPLFSAHASPDLLEEMKRMMASQPAEGIAAASAGMAERPDSSDLLPGIDVPTLVITADQDTLIPPAATEAMASAIPDAELRIIEGAGHMSNLEAPDQFTLLLSEFLSSRTEW